jgi:hypothetical protein
LNKELYNKNYDFNVKKNTPKLFNNKIKTIVNKPLTYINNDMGKIKHFTPAAQEWFNSIYAYDHNYIKSLPVADKHLMSLLKSYFNMQIKDEKIKNKRNIIKNRRESTKRVFIGRGELKHSNNKVIITFYVYNTEGMFLWGNVKKAWEKLYRPKKYLEISIYDDTKDKEVKSQYEPFNLISWLNVLKNKYLLRTLRDKKTKKEVNNILLFTKPTPNSENFELDLNNLVYLLNMLGHSKNSQELKLKINKINTVAQELELKKINEINTVRQELEFNLNKINTVVQELKLYWNKMNVVQELELNLNKINLGQKELKWSEIENIVAEKNKQKKTKNLGSLFKKSQWTLINIYTKNKKIDKIIKINKDIDKKFEIISFNRPLFLKHGQILPINENINNKRVIKLNRPLSLNEFLFQFDFDTYINNMEKNDILNKINLSTFVNIIKKKVQEGYRDAHLLLPLYLFNFNKTKFGMYLMEKFTHLVKSLYNKEVVFNIVNLKKMHLSTDIYTQAVVLKLKNRDNKLYRVLKSSLRKIKIPNFNKINEKKNKPNKNEFIDNKIRNSLINSMFTKEDVKDPLNNLLLKFFPSAENLQKSLVKKGSVKNYSVSLKDYVLMYLKHIKVRGIRVEAKGRLTRRFTASRSVFKMKWKGGLKNVDSSFKGLSTIMLRGYVKSNAQYSFLSSKNRNGAFGVKGWVSNK